MALRRNKKNPDERGFSRNDQKKMLAADTPFVIKEAYNTIRTSLLFTQKGESCPVFVVTSPDANNGKTINTINLAISFAQMGKRTLIIDSDMRNPTVHRMFNIPVTNGLSEILAGLTDNITVSKTNVENLSILSSGKIPPNPAELLASSRIDLLLSFVKGHYDCVFIDTPPINLVTDASAFAGKVTGYVMIVKASARRWWASSSMTPPRTERNTTPTTINMAESTNTATTTVTATTTNKHRNDQT
ncbi:MAG: hypothetical protein BHV98_03570 [Clostridium sp. CAG:217_53_7]|nr:MAG: hypothetical protein BHV98_03570 [Clostridium sp. CAG:217_53_7]